MMPNSMRAKSEAVKSAAADVERLSVLLKQRSEIMRSYGAESPQNARDRYENTHASVALGEASNEDLAEARRALAEAESSHRKLEEQRAEDNALAAGVQRRLDLAQKTLGEAEAAFLDEQIRWVNAELEKADTEYIEHGRATAAAMVRVETLRWWLRGHGQVTPGFAPGNFELTVHPLSVKSFQAACDANPDCGENLGEVWQRNIFPRLESASAIAALALEMDDAVSSRPDDIGETGLIAGAKRLARKLSA